MTSTEKIPTLRFPEFVDELTRYTLNDISLNGFNNGVFNDPRKIGKGYRLINVKDMYTGSTINVNDLTLIDIEDNEFLRNKVEYGDIFFTRSSIVKEGIAHSNVFLNHYNDITFDGHLIRMRPNPLITISAYLSYQFQTYFIRKQLIRSGKTTTMTTIGQVDIASVNMLIPTLPEQQKIADFLSTIDKKIEQLNRKKELLEQYKKGVMQGLFAVGKDLSYKLGVMSDEFITPIRFKDENGNDYPDWEEKRLGDIANRVTEKNRDNFITFVLTNSATEGVVSQLEYFDKDIANQYNLDGYYIILKDDFVYNPRISSSAPVGPIKRNKLKTGVMSPLYLVFRFTDENLDFFEFFFETTHWHRYMHSVANFGARHDRMNITKEDFLKLPISLPCKKEREKISNFLKDISMKLNCTNNQLNQITKFKKGLLQQMFV